MQTAKIKISRGRGESEGRVGEGMGMGMGMGMAGGGGAVVHDQNLQCGRRNPEFESQNPELVGGASTAMLDGDATVTPWRPHGEAKARQRRCLGDATGRPR